MLDNARGRLPGKPVAIVDIGSNSVRLVSYESRSRAPTPTFNEKALCGLGRGVAMTGLLPEDGVLKALAALQRFRVLCDMMGIRDVRGIATAAVRDAANGSEFLNRAERVLGCKIELLSGQREAKLSALGVISSIYKTNGLVGDLGGGSLELTDVRDGECSPGVTLPLGGLSLMDLSERSPKKAARIVREKLAGVKALQGLPGRTFYAVGGTWRALARLHMRQRQYPMNVMHNYVIPSRDALEFASLVERIEVDALLSIESVSAARRPLLAYGAAVLEEIIRQSNPKEIVVSALGVREGLIYSQLSPEEQAGDPLILSAREFNQLRSRAPDHGDELYGWTSRLIESTHLEEDSQDRRLRHAACLLSDISWRAHPDYRGVQAYDLVVNAAFIGVDHPSRAFLALAASYRHMSNEDPVSPQSRALVTARQLDRARILGAAMRVAYNISAAMPGVLPRAPMVCAKGRVILTLPADLAPLSGERLLSRMRQFGRLVGAEPEIRTSV
jgi:exopolyphosphatase/guanosine-5'-triphosphate,3'-diphosphate pyrophosphatase